MRQKITSSAFWLLILSVALAASVQTTAADYTSGIFVVNEDWYGHQNSTVNYLQPDNPDQEYWLYRVVQTENPGRELGCTNQFGAIWDGRFFLIAKQDKDPGASISGGRITVCDAKTMKILHQSAVIDPSGGKCDGRAFIGIDSHKGYISTSNGIWVFDLDTYKVTHQIEGTANPTPANLYRSQCGSMVEAGGRIFAAHQKLGLLVIDPTDDKLIATLDMSVVNDKAGIGSVVKSADGNLWLSVAANTNGSGAALPYLIKVDPISLETKVIEIGDGMYPPSNSWYAWTPDSFCASEKENALFWAGGPNSWFSNQKIFRYDIDSGETSLIIDLEAEAEGWKLYGCSMRVDPRTDLLYLSLYRDFNNQTYITRQSTNRGQTIAEFDMIANYWFPSLFVFPPSDGSGVGTQVAEDDTETRLYTLQGIPLTTDRPEPGIYIRRQGQKVTKILVR